MIDASQLHAGNLILINSEVYKVLSVSLSGSAKAEKQIKVSMKSIPEGKFHQTVFHHHEKIENITPDIKKAQYEYSDDENIYFMDEATYEQFPMPKAVFGNKLFFLKEGETFNVYFYNNKPIDIFFPPRIRLKVIESPPSIADGSNIYKRVRLENGMEIDAPQFIKEGDIIEVDTEAGHYIDRVQ